MWFYALIKLVYSLEKMREKIGPLIKMFLFYRKLKGFFKRKG